MTIWAVVPASGTGRRMGSDIPKQYLTIEGKSVLEHTLSRLLEVSGLERITVITAALDKRWDTLPIASHPSIARQAGGDQRYISVLNGVKSLQSEAAPTDWVLVHDAARPCVRVTDIEKLISKVSQHDTGGLLGIPVSNTLKRLHQDRFVQETIDRTDIWQALTPQLFRYEILLEALQLAATRTSSVTDEAAAVEMLGHTPCMVEGAADNIKITTGGDLEMAGFILSRQAAEQ